MATWRDNLAALIENGGPYAGMGGITALANDLGISRQTIHDWKAERNAPTMANRRAMAQLAEPTPGGR